MKKKEYYIESGEGIQSDLGVDFFLQTLPPETRVRSHIHPAIEILLIVDGRVILTLEEQNRTLTPGDVVLIRSNVVHRVTPIGEVVPRYYVLKVHPRILFDFSSPETGARYLSFFSSPEYGNGEFFSESDDPALPEIRHRLVGTVPPGGGNCADFERKVAAAELLLTLYRNGTLRSGREITAPAVGGDTVRRIYDVTTYLKKHFAESPSAADCAARANMSFSYFSRVFKKVTGKSFCRYLNILRVNAAEEMLKTGNRSVTEIAQECGFGDAAYFIAVYKKIRGKTPLSERK